MKKLTFIKLRIDQANLQLFLNQDFDFSSEGNQHRCDDCDFCLNQEAFEIFDQLPALEISVSEEAKINLIYIAGYVTKMKIPTNTMISI